MKKGFTLIELLAVIVILAIIALIASPIIIGLIDDARKEAFKDSGYGIIKAGELLFSKDLLNSTTEEVTFTYTNGVESSSVEGEALEYNGTKPKTGTVKINTEGQVAITIHNGKYCVEKGYNDSEITLSDKTAGNCTLISLLLLPNGELCGDVFVDSRDTAEYETVKIGKQCWMASNLKYTGNGCLDKTWGETDLYDACQSHTANLEEEILYQWGAAMNWDGVDPSNPIELEGKQGLCPEGWHIPTDAEWNELEMFLGLSQFEASIEDYRGTDLGNQLKSESPSWCYGTTTCATSGFNAKPAGYYDIDGLLINDGFNAYFWTSSIYRSFAFSRYLVTSDSGVLRYHDSMAYGASVRCLLNG